MYGDSHVKDKTVSRPSYLYHEDPYIGETASLNWNGLQDLCLIQGGNHSHITILKWMWLFLIFSFFCTATEFTKPWLIHANLVYIWWLQMSWFLKSADHQQTSYWLCHMGRFLSLVSLSSYANKNFEFEFVFCEAESHYNMTAWIFGAKL